MLASSNHHYTPMEIVPMEEPLFDEDWLHEHNLDILFDLFEEEVERKGLDNAPAATNSSNIFGSSPVTSYLFGTSPPFASALDIYDLLYFDNNQQPIINSQQQPSQTAPPNTTTPTSTSTSTSTNQTKATPTTKTKTTPTKNHIAANSLNTTNIQDTTTTTTTTTKTYNVSGLTNVKQQFASRNVTTTTNNNNNNNNSYLANSITNAMRIKRRLKKGQNEGTSLLAKPFSNGNNAGGSCTTLMNNQNNSDKSGTKIATNLKKPNCNDNSTRGIDIKQSQHNRNRHLQHIQHNVHHITGCSIILEHAYAVRGH